MRTLPSLDLIHHRYEQDVALDKLRDSQLDIDPNGLEKELGVELDLVAGFSILNNIQSEWLLGYFQPGTAINDAGKALFLSGKFSYEF